MNKRALCNARDNKRTGFLSRLGRDTRGNTLAIVGAAFIPLTAMIGSGVDVSRAYMAKNRLQNACDSAALAGRRKLQADTMSPEVIAEAQKFLNFNFPQGTYETDSFTPVVTKPSRGTIRIHAETKIPTSIMKIFGFGKLPLSVTCEASQNFVNTDIMLVLDVTGSMAQNNKIGALRDAVMALYRELAPIQAELEANGMRLRYGVVPYSSAVNVGRLIYEKNPQYLADSWTYQTRIPIYSTSVTERVSENMTNSQCNNYRQARTPSDSFPAVQKIVARPGSGTYRPCDVTTITYTTDVTTDFRFFVHEAAVIDTSVYKTFASTPRPTVNPNRPRNDVWEGCIEEANTVVDIPSTLNVPQDAFDLNIDHIPSGQGSQWRPAWPEVVYTRYGEAAEIFDWRNEYWQEYDSDDRSMANSACPAESKKLQSWTEAGMQTYVNSLQPVGNTYHDIGMIWGARLISSGGIFGAENPDTHHSMPVSRHIIFMTDGELQPSSSTYSTYGIERLDQRVTGSANASNQYGRHETRFRAVCNSAKSKGVSIWVVAFATAPSAALNECATSASQVAVASDRDKLIEKFTEIGKNIGSLRLSL